MPLVHPIYKSYIEALKVMEKVIYANLFTRRIGSKGCQFCLDLFTPDELDKNPYFLAIVRHFFNDFSISQT